MSLAFPRKLGTPKTIFNQRYVWPDLQVGVNRFRGRSKLF